LKIFEFRISNFEFRNVGLNRNRKIHISSLDEELVSAAQSALFASTPEISVGVLRGGAQPLDSNGHEIFAVSALSMPAGRGDSMTTAFDFMKKI
jgi:hypothetical protein